MDEVEMAEANQAIIDEARLQEAKFKAAQIPEGHSGVCDKCGEECQRLVGAEYFNRKSRYDVAEEIEEGICARCRDTLKLP